jgi:hypothetical protein
MMTRTEQRSCHSRKKFKFISLPWLKEGEIYFNKPKPTIMNFIKVSADEVIWQPATNSHQVVGHSDFYLNVNSVGEIRGNVVLPFGGDTVQIGNQLFKNFTLAQTGGQAPQMDTI